MSELITPYHVDQLWNNDDGVEVATVCGANGVFVLIAFADDVDEILKRINGYEKLEQSNKELLEALKRLNLATNPLVHHGGGEVDRARLSAQKAITNAEREG